MSIFESKPTHLEDEIQSLKHQLLEMSFRVDDAVSNACDALFLRSEEMAIAVIEGDSVINQIEMDIDEKGHNLSALGPLAKDLRRIMMILKINTEFERMGDHAVNIAEKCLSALKEEAQIDDLSDLERMAKVTQKILRDSLDAFLKEDVRLARHVLKLDDEVDTLNVNFFYQMKSVMQADPHRVGVAMDLTMIAHNLERIADLSGNLAEEVIFLAQGKEVRHRKSLN